MAASNSGHPSCLRQRARARDAPSSLDLTSACGANGTADVDRATGDCRSPRPQLARSAQLRFSGVRRRCGHRPRQRGARGRPMAAMMAEACDFCETDQPVLPAPHNGGGWFTAPVASVPPLDAAMPPLRRSVSCLANCDLIELVRGHRIAPDRRPWYPLPCTAPSPLDEMRVAYQPEGTSAKTAKP